MYLEVHNMLRRERYCRKHLTTSPKRTKVGDIFRCVMSLPQKHNFEMHMRFWFWCSKHGRWQFFSWGQVFNLRQGPKKQKNYGPHESWGGARTAPWAPRLSLLFCHLGIFTMMPILHYYIHVSLSELNRWRL